MRGIRDIYDRFERLACTAIAACSPNIAAIPPRQRENGTWAQPTPTEWAEHVAKHGEALRKTLRWAWAARMEGE